MIFPRPILALHQLELSSHCDLRCVYCPNAHLQRPKLFMSQAHFERALVLAKRFVDAGTQLELNLAGIGESTLHPDFPAMALRARAVLGPLPVLTLATNGLNIANDDERSTRILDALQAAGVRTFVSLHRPERAGIAVDKLRSRPSIAAGYPTLLAGVSADPSVNSDDWAGQVDWHRSHHSRMVCQFLNEGKAMVLADGRVTTCCLDASGAGVIGHVDDDLPGGVGLRSSWEQEPWSLCKTCQYVVPD